MPTTTMMVKDLEVDMMIVEPETGAHLVISKIYEVGVPEDGGFTAPPRHMIQFYDYGEDAVMIRPSYSEIEVVG